MLSDFVTALWFAKYQNKLARECKPKERVSVGGLGAGAWIEWRDFNGLLWEVECFRRYEGRVFLREAEDFCIIYVVLLLVLKCRSGNWRGGKW